MFICVRVHVIEIFDGIKNCDIQFCICSKNEYRIIQLKKFDFVNNFMCIEIIKLINVRILLFTSNKIFEAIKMSLLKQTNHC